MSVNRKDGGSSPPRDEILLFCEKFSSQQRVSEGCPNARQEPERETTKCSRLSHLIYVPKNFFATHCSALESPLFGDSVGVGMGLLSCTGRELFTSKEWLYVAVNEQLLFWILHAPCTMRGQDRKSVVV